MKDRSADGCRRRFSVNIAGRRSLARREDQPRAQESQAYLRPHQSIWDYRQSVILLRKIYKDGMERSSKGDRWGVPIRRRMSDTVSEKNC